VPSLALARAAQRERRADFRKQPAPSRRDWAAARRRTTTRPDENVARKLVELHVVAERRERYLPTPEPDALEKWWARYRGRSEPHLAPVERVRAFLIDSAGQRYERRQPSSWETVEVLQAIDATVAAAAHLEEL
jgi:hypothetical protein